MPEKTDSIYLFEWKFKDHEPTRVVRAFENDALPLIPNLLDDNFETVTISRAEHLRDLLQAG